MKSPIIREITLKDNQQVAKVIRKVLEDLGVPKVGTAYADKILDTMFEAYDKAKATYFVVEENKHIIGCAGIAQLDDYDGNVCELQENVLFRRSKRQRLRC